MFTKELFESGHNNTYPSATMYGPSSSCSMLTFQPAEATDPVLDDSDPCCVDLSTLPTLVEGCGTGPAAGPGSTGPLEAPAAGTWTSTLGATVVGGSSGFYVVPDPSVSESWGQ